MREPALLDVLPARTPSGLVNVIIDTPKGSCEKFKYDPEAQCYRLSRILPRGSAFPHDFGSIPQTLAEDGDPLDIVLISEAGSFPGCLMNARLIGVLAAEQMEGGKAVRNDRLLGVPVTSVNTAEFSRIEELPAGWLADLEHFFVSYNRAHGREYKPIGRGGPDQAAQILEAAEQRCRLARRHGGARQG